jgi:hypothetical protein
MRAGTNRHCVNMNRVARPVEQELFSKSTGISSIEHEAVHRQSRQHFDLIRYECLLPPHHDYFFE